MLLAKKYSIISVLALVIIQGAACQTNSNPVNDVSEPETAPSLTPTKAFTPTTTIDVQATTNAQSTTYALSTANAQKTAEAHSSATAVAQETQKALDSQATATQAMAIKQTATAETVHKATAQAQTMESRIAILAEDGIVADTNGKYARLDDFDESWAQINWFKWWFTGYEIENFAIRSDLVWSSASDKANWFNSGCGFIFGALDNDNFHVSHLVLDGHVTLKYWHKDEGNWIAKRPAKNITTPDGKAEIMMVVYDKRVTFYVNGVQALSEYAGLLKPGALALTLISGTNKDYGTRCQMSDIDLWIFE